MQAALARRGIRVDQGWVDAAARAGCTTEEQLFVQFLAHDLRKAATAASLPRPLGDTLGGAWVLQVEAVAEKHVERLKTELLLGSAFEVFWFFVLFEPSGRKNAPRGPKGRPKPRTGVLGHWAKFCKHAKN